MNREKPTSIRLPLALAKRLAAEAKRQDRPASWIVRKAIEAYLDQKRGTNE